MSLSNDNIMSSLNEVNRIDSTYGKQKHIDSFQDEFVEEFDDSIRDDDTRFEHLKREISKIERALKLRRDAE